MSSDNAQTVLNFIESTVQRIEDRLTLRPPQCPSVTIRRITGLKPQTLDGSDIFWVAEDHEVVYSFPGKTKEEAWRFTCVLRILSEIHIAISDQVIVTKRDIFYHDPALFLKQEVVDRFIDDIAHTCKVRRSDLNVVASPKGLVIGLRSLEDESDPETIPTSLHGPPLHVKWLLVVEKELATFHTLVEQKCHLSDKIGRGVLVTAKGYPDLATRQFLRTMVDDPGFNGPILGLFDYDPYGVDILKCYRVGSKASVGEKMLAMPHMKWIGVKSRDLTQSGSGMPLSQSDRMKARRLLETMSDSTELADCCSELQTILMLNVKAEIQALDDGPGKLRRWLEDRVMEQL